MKIAAIEKDRLENRQRTFRKYYEATNKQHQPRYFKKWRNPADNEEYWIYNNLYFENDRLKQDWSNLPDIYGETYPEDVMPYIVKSKLKKEE